MILHIYAKIKALNWKPDAESVIQLEADLRPSEVQQLAAFGGTTLQVQLLKQQPDMFEDNEIEQQPGLFDELDLPVATGPTCTKCGGQLEELVCLQCGQRHRLGEAPKPALCGDPARFTLTGTDSRGREIGDVAVCEAHLDVADPDREMQIDDAPEGTTCQWELSEEEIAARREANPLCVCGHRLGIHSIGLTCLDCNCMAFRPAAEAADEEADPEADAAEVEREMKDAEREMGAEFQSASEASR